MAKYIKTEQGYERKIPASGDEQHSEIFNSLDTNVASGYASHAEGASTTASGLVSHAEGASTTASGMYSHAEGWSTTASSDASHAEGRGTTASGSYSHAEGSSTSEFSSVVTATNPTNADIITAWKSKNFSLAKGKSSHVEGKDNLALGSCSHAEGNATTASGGYSHAEGFYTTASSDYSHAEGYYTTASGGYSHAEGSSTTASGNNSHAEGNNTTASGQSSHTEGSSTTASGQSSHAEGFFTKAGGVYQHAQGKYNIEDSAGTYADIIGNGTSSKRSNAATVDWSGNAWYAGDVYVGSTSGTNKDAGSKKLATEEYASGLGITNATVGQIAKITAVDSNGKPTAWEPVDLPSGGGGEVDPPLLVDYTVPDGSTASSITFTAADDGTAFNLNNRCYFVVDAIFPDSTSKTIGITSNGNTQGAGPFSPVNLANVTVKEMHIFGKYTRDFGTRYTTWVQYRPNVNNGYPTSDGSQFGRSDHALLMENTKGTAVKSLMFVAIGTGDTIYWAPGTRVRIWGN